MERQRSERERRLANSFREHLAADTVGLDTRHRLTWLFGHLQEYVARWLGFCRLEQVTMRSVLESDLHTVLLLATDAIDDEVNAFGVPTAFLERWRRFAALVRSLGVEADKNVGTELAAAVEGIRSSWEEVTIGK